MSTPSRSAPLKKLIWGLKQVWEAVTTDPLATPLSIFFGSRIALYILVLFFVGFFPGESEGKPNFIEAFSQWDGAWYLSIATDGYRWPGSLDIQSNVAFFPLYPLLGRMVGWLVADARWSLFIVSNVSFAFYLYFLYKLTCHDLDQPSASRTVLYVAIFPLSFIFSCLYSESTSFAFTIAAFYYARVGKWHLAIPLAVLTTLTRLAGLVILVPLAYEYLRQRGLRPQALLLGIIPTGIAGFAIYMWVLTGNPLSFLLTHKAWYRTPGPPWKPLIMGLERLTWPLGQYVTAIAIVDFANIVLFLGLTLLVFKHLPAAYWLYCIPILLLSLSTTIDPTKAPPTGSIPRSLMALFPCFMVLGKMGRNRYLDQALRATFAILLGIISIYFFSHFWVV
ncbi:MAG: hypothetical protein E3J21_09700 [Anaerolineales bacterium]|nr:MAG: hypothetical protein E3J21_09700 [Anaerolineales bacterium]